MILRLRENGFIFVSINDIELYALKMLCDEIFGENNYLANMIWQSTPGSNTGEDVKTVTEYVLLYAKDKQSCKIATQEIADTEKYKNQDEYFSSRGGYVLNKLDRRMTGQHYSEALNYAITAPDGEKIFPGSSNVKLEHWNWRWSSSKVEWGIKEGFIVFKKNKGKWSIYFKQYEKVNNENQPISRTLPYQNLMNIDGANSARGTREVMDIFSRKAFDYPKPLNLLLHLLKMFPSNNCTVLDFFAGSGTTGHAVMKLNAEDGGSRQFILCTNNENNICEEVTYERIKRVINGYGDTEGIPANLKYYRTDFVPKNEEYLSDALLEHIAEMIQLEHGIKLDGQNYIMILDDEEADELAAHWSEYPDVKALYISKDVLLTSEQNALFKDVEIHIIPDYYFNFELREVGETW